MEYVYPNLPVLEVDFLTSCNTFLSFSFLLFWRLLRISSTISAISISGNETLQDVVRGSMVPSRSSYTRQRTKNWILSLFWKCLMIPLTGYSGLLIPSLCSSQMREVNNAKQSEVFPKQLRTRLGREKSGWHELFRCTIGKFVLAR